MSDWWIDELAHAGQEHLDSDYVAGYERKAGYDPAEDLAVLERFGFGPTSTLVDIGAGTGVFALAAAPLCRHVFAVDLSEAMVKALRKKVTQLGVDNVSVVQAGILSYQHVGDPPQFVFSRNTLHQLPDFWKGLALQRVRALLGRGAILRLRDLAFDFEPAQAREKIDAWMKGAVDDPNVGFTAAELAQHVKGEFSTFSWLLEELLERCGFRITERDYRRHVYGSYLCRTD
jgi:ubiquinone/menaquinone biosynthesis C-methylase UbiE